MTPQHQTDGVTDLHHDPFDGLMQMPHTPCKIPEAKSVGPVRKMFQRVNPIAITATVRYDAVQRKWSVIHPTTHQPLQHFECGVMENVKFSSATVQEGYGCGSRDTKIGMATGSLYLHRHPKKLDGARNLSFKDGSFKDHDGRPIAKADSVALMPDRRAIYWEDK